MPNVLILESVPYKDMVSGWKDGETYRVELTITQESNDGKAFRASVNEVTDYGDVDTEEAPPVKPAKPSAKKEPKAAY